MPTNYGHVPIIAYKRWFVDGDIIFIRSYAWGDYFTDKGHELNEYVSALSFAQGGLSGA